MYKTTITITTVVPKDIKQILEHIMEELIDKPEGKAVFEQFTLTKGEIWDEHIEWKTIFEGPETRTIYIWPNRDWCTDEDLEEYGRNKSDDYYSVEVSLDIDDEKLDQLIADGMYDQGR
jgi:hypothetical protein